VTSALCIYGIGRALRGRAGAADVERLRGVVVARTLERLGATFLKFGQILSTRPDLLGPGYIEALRRLQDRVPPVSFGAVQRTLDSELGRGWRSRIVEVDAKPLAAASVAQVHRAKLESGELVALKVQRVAAQHQIERDLVWMSLGARFLNRFRALKMLSLPGAVARFGEAMHDQLDFRKEAENNRRFRENFAKMKAISIPTLYEELCTRRVLAMELVEGTPANALDEIGDAGPWLARVGSEAILKMIFRDGFVHADLHPGNILLTKDREVVLVDLGLVAEIPPEMLKPWCETFMALVQQDGVELARLFYVYAPFVATDDYDAYESEVVAFFESLHGKTIQDVEVGAVVTGAMAILRRHRVQVDPVFTVVKIALLVAEGLGKQLDKEMDLMKLSAPYIMKALARAPKGKAPLREPPGRARAA
jgi:ubiquinone biosynthesis protein